MDLSSQDVHASSIGHVPKEKWEFDAGVAAVFSDMLERSIPQYNLMREAVFKLGSELTPPGTAIVDLGCSIGDGIARFVSESVGARSFLGVENSKAMLAASRARFCREIQRGQVEIREWDLQDGYPHATAGLTLCVLSMQFIPVSCRKRLLREAYENTVPGGAFILVEKIEGASSAMRELMIDIYHDFKRSAGYSIEEIKRKSSSLEGVLIPMTARENEDMLLQAGFSDVEGFWRWMNFAGWVARR